MYQLRRFGWSNRLQVPANKRKIEKTNLAPGGFDQFVTTVGDSAFAFGAPLPSGAVSSIKSSLGKDVADHLEGSPFPTVLLSCRSADHRAPEVPHALSL